MERREFFESVKETLFERTVQRIFRKRRLAFNPLLMLELLSG
jgi:hypothetical protein